MTVPAASLQQLLPGSHRHGFLRGRRLGRGPGQHFFNPIHIQAAGAAALETVQHFAGLGDLSSLIVKNAERGVTPGPLGQNSTARSSRAAACAGVLPSSTETIPMPQRILPEPGIRARPFCSVAFAPATSFSRNCTSVSERVIQVVVGISGNRITEYLRGAGRLTQMSVTVAQQSQESRVLLSCGRNLLSSFERLRVSAFAEISIGQVEFYVVGNRDWPARPSGNAG